jgi:glycosyltransferase involved in cell wall biosynthesis
MSIPERTRPALSVVIPAYNELESLEGTVKAVVAALPDPDRSELVIVDDGSSDGTLEVARAVAEWCPAHVVVVARQHNGGMGQALADGFDRATGEVVTWIPGDGEYDLTEVLAGLAGLEDHDIVLVRRRAREQAARNFVSTIMYTLIRALFAFDAHNYCGIFVVSRQRWQELVIESRDVFFTLEVALLARHRRWRIGYVVAEWRPRTSGRSKVFRPTVLVKNLLELLGFRVRLWRSR